jgi:hypothetical protein
MLEGHAVQVLHSDEGLSVLLTDVVNDADIGMIESGSRPGLALEAGQGLRIAGHFIGKKLESDEAMQACVLSLVHHAHATTAELLENAVVRDSLVDHLRILRGANGASQ